VGRDADVPTVRGDREADVVMSGPLEFAWASSGLRITTDEAIAPGKVVAFPERPHEVFMHPTCLVNLEIEMDIGTSYAQRCAMRAMVRRGYELRRPTLPYRVIRERVRHLDGVRPWGPT
jgi:hypothetical protein